MSKKWYSYFVSVEDGGSQDAGNASQGADPGAASAAQTIAEIAASVNVAPTFQTKVANPASFNEIYQAAEIPGPPHGFTVFKVAEMLKNEHIRTLPVEIKRSSVLLALDAAGVKLQDVIEDAVRRDQALDAFERVQQRALERLEADKAAENRKLQEEADRVLNELRAKIQANNEQVSKERDRLKGWLGEKQQEEQRIFDAVAPFVTPNPISTGPVGPASSAPPGAGKTSSQA